MDAWNNCDAIILSNLISTTGLGKTLPNWTFVVHFQNPVCTRNPLPRLKLGLVAAHGDRPTQIKKPIAAQATSITRHCLLYARTRSHTPLDETGRVLNRRAGASVPNLKALCTSLDSVPFDHALNAIPSMSPIISKRRSR